MKLSGRIVVWPVYFDSRFPRSRGRRLPRRLTVDNPRLEEVFEAARRLSLNPEASPGKAYPRCWWVKSGYLTVDKRGSKQKVLRMIAEEIVKSRRSRVKSSSRFNL